jgi:hypothetical protein
VVTCTNRKTRAIPASLRLRSVTAGRLSTRFQAWTTRLTEAPIESLPAIDLYAGEHWDVARRLAGRTVAGAEVELWVCSAGYGLLRADAPIVPYAATFAAGHPDSVPGGADAVAAWWDALGGWESPSSGPRSLSDLIASHPRARVLLVLSLAYLTACRGDIDRAARQITDPKQLSILSAGGRADPELADLLLPCDARLQAALGGTRQALNVRAAAHLLREGVLDHDEMSQRLEKLLADQPDLRRYQRAPASDPEVRAFIRARRTLDPSITHSRLLREFRDANRACEQARFAALFRAETGVQA